MSTNLVILENQIPVTTSLKVAEVFERKHGDVCNSIEKIAKDIQMASGQAGRTFFAQFNISCRRYKD